MAKPDACHHGRAVDLPGKIYLGTNDAQWPLQAFATPESAASWLSDDPTIRHVYVLNVNYAAELRYVPPVKATYTEEAL